MINCLKCGGEMIWSSDFSFQDYGILVEKNGFNEEAGGVVHALSCDCGAWAEVFVPE